MLERQINKGFTLIEVMIAVVIVGLLTALAYPSYQEYVRRAARAEARTAMMRMAQLQERYFTDRSQYLAITAGDLTSSTTLSAWSDANWSGTSYATRKYNLTVATANTNTTFTITATPANGFTDPACGNLTLGSDGARSSSVGDAATCWK